MSGIRVIVDLDPAGTSVRGLIATGPARMVTFSGWLELMQTLDRLLGEAQSLAADDPDAETPS
jgi:hypothetical protein